MVIPHAEIPISSIRPSDILLLLALGSVTELIHRLITHKVQSLSSAEKSLREKLRLLRYQTNKKRALGPSAFVETSKLERMVLACEKELSGYEVDRSKKTKEFEKIMKYVMMGLNAIIFIVYYGIPIMEIDGLKASELGLSGSLQSDDHAEHAAAFWKGVMFPLSYVGIGMKIARFGLTNKASSVGALSVYWSAQVLIGKVYECFAALAFR
ncbi:hypothetical protein CTEN210_09440 [Chaetoceros tenuissimus]|uniref:Uncharacterized protein n=1 Tax=Chaetoceros tenuissimus TaxID=426638 RepID=A0AAD3CYK8_9STRA|nr:hypothetical protein CTEN210_09440 [Chaetoceros tenuissimus]